MNHLELYVSHDELEKIKGCDDVYLKGAVLVRKLFLKDELGKIHLKHLLNVSNRMNTLDGMIAGLLHDVVFSLPSITFDDLVDIGIPNTIIEALKVDYEALKATHLKEDSHSKNFSSIDDYFLKTSKVIDSKNDLAIELLIADIMDNYKATDLEHLSIRELFLINEKYARNLIRLKASMEKRKKKC